MLRNSAVDSVQNVNSNNGEFDSQSSRNNIKIDKSVLKKDSSRLIALPIRQRPVSKLKHKLSYLAEEKTTNSGDRNRVCDLICMNNGTCKIDAHGKRCDCPLGTQGEFCETCKYIT